jgi:hypothetical protein
MSAAPQPEAILDVSSVRRMVQRTRDPSALPGERLPVAPDSHSPWACAAYEYTIEERPTARLSVLVEQRRYLTGDYHMTVRMLELASQVGKPAQARYFGSGEFFLSDVGVLTKVVRVEDPDADMIDAGEFLERAYPMLAANHLLNSGQVRARDLVRAGSLPR